MKAFFMAIFTDQIKNGDITMLGQANFHQGKI
jgi:hypothetical protein